MQLYDVSVPISNELVTWPGDPIVQLKDFVTIEGGAPCNVKQLSFGLHTGTHIDAPKHFFNNGISTADIALNKLIGSCIVIEINAEKSVTIAHLHDCDLSVYSKVLLKTRNSQLWDTCRTFNKKFVSLDLSAAQHFIDQGVELIGIDYLSVEAFNSENDGLVHKALLSNDIIILEGLNLSSVDPGEYELICLPLKIEDSDGAPVRAILRR